MPEQDDLQLTGRVFANVADTESARFARELARVLSVIERDLLGLIGAVRAKERGVVARVGRLLTLRREIRKAVTDAGFSGLATRASIDAVSAMADAATGSRLIAAATKLGAVSSARLEAMASLMRADLLGLGDVMAQQLWRASMTSIYTATPPEKIVASLSKVIDRTRAQVQTLFDTQVSVVGRQIVADDRDRDETQAFIYVGPIDGVVRQWCLDHMGKVYTRDRIEAMDNGQLPNPFLTGGGYACRHSWMSVSEPDLIAIANTGERAPGFSERVKTAETIKASRKGRRRQEAAA